MEPSYLSLMSRGKELFPLFNPSMKELMTLCEEEANWIADAARKLKGVPKGLLSLSTGVFCDSSPVLWEQAWDGDEPEPGHIARRSAISAANWAILDLILTRRRLAYFCQRADWGPLTVTLGSPQDGATEPEWRGATGLELRLHNDSIPGVVPIAIGGKTRLYLGMKSTIMQQEVQATPEDMAYAIAFQIEERELQLDKSNRKVVERMAKAGQLFPLSYDITMYLPTRILQVKPHISAAVEKAVVEKLACRGLTKARYKDVFKFEDIAKAPICEACGWKPSDL